MVKSYILVAWRTIMRHRLFSFINIFGLSLSIALGMVILSHVVNVLQYESFNPNRDRIYRIVSNIESKDKMSWTLASTPLPLKESLSHQLGIEDVVRIYPSLTEDASSDKKTIKTSTAFTGPSFLSTMGFTLEHGVNENALSSPRSVILSHGTSKKFFGEADPTGKTINFETLGQFTITGVIKEPEYDTHIVYDAYLSEATVALLENVKVVPEKSESWDSFQSAYTYVLLQPNSQLSQLNEVLQEISKKINSPSNSGTFTFKSQPLTSVTPGSDDIGNDIGSGTTWGKLMAEVAIGLVIVLAACFNYTNLTLARSLSRVKEIGVRKIVGAKRRQLFAQHITEALLIAFLALIFGKVTQTALYEFNLFERPARTPDVVETIAVILFTFVVGLLAGFLPALILSSFKAIRMMRNLASEKIMGAISLRKSLIVFQFAISLVILIFMMVFHSQFSFMETVDPGFRIANVMSVPINKQSYSTLKSELSRIHGVSAVAGLSDNFGRYPTGTVGIRRGDKPALNMNYFFADGDAIATSNLFILYGHNFGSNNVREDEVILNEEAAHILGIKDLRDAVGEQIILEDTIKITVAGVIKNFYSEGVGIAYRPLLLRHKEGTYKILNLVVNESDKALVESKARAILKQLSPDTVAETFWLDEQHQQRYGEMGSISMLGMLAFMAISIASLGLLGLVIYSVETRRKEISIRKVIGASVQHLLYLLSKGFASLILIAGVIAVPLSWVGSELFLMNFANRIQVGLRIPVICFGGLFLLGIVMIVSQAVRTAFENPVKNLTNE